MAFQTVDLYVNDTTPQKNPVSGVVVKVLSTDGKLVFGQVATDSSGHAGFLLPDGTTYQARFFKFGVSFTNPQLFTVPSGQAASFNIPAQLITPPVPTDARLCTAFGFFRDITGAPQSDLEMQFISKFDPTWVDGSGVVKERVKVFTDKKGYAEINLFRLGHYECTVVGEEDITRCIKVPDQPNVNLPDLIFPIVQSVVTSPSGPAFSVGVGQSVLIGITVYGSDGENLGSGQGDVIYSSSNLNVLGFGISKLGLTLMGVAPGVVMVTLTRSNKSIVHIPDLPIQGSPFVVTVTP